MRARVRRVVRGRGRGHHHGVLRVRGELAPHRELTEDLAVLRAGLVGGARVRQRQRERQCQVSTGMDMSHLAGEARVGGGAVVVPGAEAPGADGAGGEEYDAADASYCCGVAHGYLIWFGIKDLSVLR